MAFDWTTLTGPSATPGSIANWLSKSSLATPAGTGSPADYVLQEACSWIYRRLRHWQMLSGPLPFTMTQGQDTLAFPANFLEPDAIWYINGSPFFLTQKDPNQVYMSWAYDGTGARVQAPPVIYSFNGTQIQLDSQPDQAYLGFWTFYQQLPALSATNPTNFLTDRYQRLLRLSCMAGACEWAKDNGQGNFDRNYFDQLAMDEIYTAQAESDRARRASINAASFIGGGDMGFPAYGYR